MNATASPPKATSTPTSTPPDQLQGHILSTYFTLRIGIVVASVLLPTVLYFVGQFYYHQPLQPSISDYYFKGEGLRNWFVGTLSAVGAFLYLYKGFSNKENIALNLAGIFAVSTGMIPCDCGDESQTFSLHGVSAVSFFLAMAFVCLFCASETLELSTDEAFKRRYARYYKIIGGLLVASPAAAFAVSAWPGLVGSRVFFIEAFAIFIFASYWAVKSLEMKTTQAEKAALEEKAMRVPGHGVVPTAKGQELVRQPGIR